MRIPPIYCMYSIFTHAISSIRCPHRLRSTTTTCFPLSFTSTGTPNLVRPCDDHCHFGRPTRRYESNGHDGECTGRGGRSRRPGRHRIYPASGD